MDWELKKEFDWNPKYMWNSYGINICCHEKSIVIDCWIDSGPFFKHFVNHLRVLSTFPAHQGHDQDCKERCWAKRAQASSGNQSSVWATLSFNLTPFRSNLRSSQDWKGPGKSSSGHLSLTYRNLNHVACDTHLRGDCGGKDFGETTTLPYFSRVGVPEPYLHTWHQTNKIHPHPRLNQLSSINSLSADPNQP